jgi:hypothetical protein
MNRPLLATMNRLLLATTNWPLLATTNRPRLATTNRLDKKTATLPEIDFWHSRMRLWRVLSTHSVNYEEFVPPDIRG